MQTVRRRCSAMTLPAPRLPPCFPEVSSNWSRTRSAHRDPQRYSFCYALIWRIQQGERALLDVASDPLVHRLLMLRKAVASGPAQDARVRAVS